MPSSFLVVIFEKLLIVYNIQTIFISNFFYKTFEIWKSEKEFYNKKKNYSADLFNNFPRVHPPHTHTHTIPC